MNKHLFQSATFFLCISVLSFAACARSQGQTNPVPQAGANPAKEQLNPEEPEANTSASTEALQKATQNPVASLISLPIQNNNNFGMNPGYRTQDVLNIQPVIPIGISKDWNLLVRWIMPVVWQPLPNQPSTPETGVYGLGDMVPTFFISPKNPGRLIWGAGPVFQLPTATSTYLGQGKLGIGPSIVALMQPGHWTLGVLACLRYLQCLGPRKYPRFPPRNFVTDEWGIGPILPLKKDFSKLLQLGVIGYDQWQVTADGGTIPNPLPIGSPTVPASVSPFY